MRATLLLLMLVLAPARAEAQTTPGDFSMGISMRVAPPASAPSGRGPAPRVHFFRAFGGGLLGASIGGGLGLLIGAVDLNDFETDPAKLDEEGVKIPLAMPGVLVGSTIGVLAAERAGMEGMEVGLTAVGSVFGGLLASITAAA